MRHTRVYQAYSGTYCRTVLAAKAFQSAPVGRCPEASLQHS